jgi:hypothetical protein
VFVIVFGFFCCFVVWGGAAPGAGGGGGGEGVLAFIFKQDLETRKTEGVVRLWPLAPLNRAEYIVASERCFSEFVDVPLVCVALLPCMCVKKIHVARPFGARGG